MWKYKYYYWGYSFANYFNQIHFVTNLYKIFKIEFSLWNVWSRFFVLNNFVEDFPFDWSNFSKRYITPPMKLFDVRTRIHFPASEAHRPQNGCISQYSQNICCNNKFSLWLEPMYEFKIEMDIFEFCHIIRIHKSIACENC